MIDSVNINKKPHPFFSFDTFFLLLLFILSNKIFYIGPWWSQSGKFNIADVGNFLIIIVLFFRFFFSKDRKILINPISLVIVFYLSLVFIHSLFALFHFQQSFFDTLVAVRHQLYFLSFFLFLLILDNMKKIVALLDLIEIISIGVIILSFINYSGITIFSHKWAEGHGVRSGITRAFIPAMGLISFATLWSFSKWIHSSSRKVLAGKSLFFIAVHFIRQTRMRLFGVLFIIGATIILKRKWKILFIIIILSLISTISLSLFLPENIVTSQFKKGYENFTDKSGTWAFRKKQIQIDLKEFYKHPWIGDGKSAIREHGGSWKQRKLRTKTYRSDLGFAHMLKFYGIVGIGWLFIFFGIQIFMVLKVLILKSKSKEKMLAMFCLANIGFHVFTFLTLNHFKDPNGIILLSFNAAIACFLYTNISGKTTVELKPEAFNS